MESTSFLVPHFLLLQSNSSLIACPDAEILKLLLIPKVVYLAVIKS